ncbi:MAG: pyrroline-5-carboxylate reductase [Acidimicrobiia bacterium]
MDTVAVIGVGAMGTALVRGLEAAGWQKLDLRLADARVERVGELGAAGHLAWTDPTIAAESARVVVVAVKPDVVADVLAELAPVLGPGHVIVSIAAGVRIATIEAHLPGVPVVRAMPNTPALVGAGITGYAAGSAASEDDVAAAAAVLSALGETVPVDEADLDAVTAVSGSGPAYVFLLTEALEEAARAEGLDPGAAAALARQTVVGAGSLLAADTAKPEELRRRVTSPGGTTEAALRSFEQDGFRRIVRSAVHAARTRSEELGAAAGAGEGAEASPMADG